MQAGEDLLGLISLCGPMYADTAERPQMTSRPLKHLFFSLLLLSVVSCRSAPSYDRLPIPDRKLNLLGLEMIATQHLDARPDDFDKFSRILTEADNVLQSDSMKTHAGVLSWIRRAMKREGIDESAPVFLFLQSVYLKGWEGAYFSRVDEGEREYLYDLMGAVMGGMHRCTCAGAGTMSH